MNFSDISPFTIVRKLMIMCIPQVKLQLFFYGRQQESEFEDTDTIIGIDLRSSMGLIKYYVFLSFGI